jgi:hypothetical protein
MLIPCLKVPSNFLYLDSFQATRYSSGITSSEETSRRWGRGYVHGQICVSTLSHFFDFNGDERIGKKVFRGILKYIYFNLKYIYWFHFIPPLIESGI